MKDAFGNEYVKPTACSHPGCLPWQCLQAPPPPPPPMPDRIRRMTPEQRAREERDFYARELAFEDHRKRVGRVYARRFLVCAIIPALLGLSLFAVMLEEAARASPDTILKPVVTFVVLTGVLYGLTCMVLGPPNVPMPQSRSSSADKRPRT